jgi:hypothetical protein
MDGGTSARGRALHSPAPNHGTQGMAPPPGIFPFLLFPLLYFFFPVVATTFFLVSCVAVVSCMEGGRGRESDGGGGEGERDGGGEKGRERDGGGGEGERERWGRVEREGCQGVFIHARVDTH